MTKNAVVLISLCAMLVLGAQQAVAGPSCTCRFAGQKFNIGDVACIRGKLAQCGYVLNNTAWHFLADICPLTSHPGSIKTRLALLQPAGISHPLRPKPQQMEKHAP